MIAIKKVFGYWNATYMRLPTSEIIVKVLTDNEEIGFAGGLTAHYKEERTVIGNKAAS